jgi:Uncharacterized protein conserved in bacteria
MNQFRCLTPEEIDVRVATCSDKGCTLLLYKDARVDQNILDEVFGIYGWERSHQLIGDRLYCTVKIKNPDTGEWISKQDVGTESNTEKEKGQASDSFKRACFNLGIGRELYSAPFIWIEPDKFNLRSGNNGKATTYDRFRVKSIGYDKGVINHLVVVNDSKKGMVVYSIGRPQTETEKTETESPAPKKDPNTPITAKQVLTLKMMCKKHEMPESKIFEKYQKTKIEELTVSDWADFGKTGQELLIAWDKEHQ